MIVDTRALTLLSPTLEIGRNPGDVVMLGFDGLDPIIHAVSFAVRRNGAGIPKRSNALA
ncbi:hypothetical protein P9273_25890 [Mesorhizobium sp. WSM4935]|uniref:hypothetical protein n=1 Tax=Mesorhizobium sp. WSM4935 TaxID=3038547 RepID=UPI00241582C0|nr:hypothetical protein [Mesorhizobium sp. WSM4935]MDG4878513.1 hypothetical protein [Mesorhizobium sp. WSM4935]